MNLLFLISKQFTTGPAGIEYGSFNDDLNDMHNAQHYTAKNQIQTSFLCRQADPSNEELRPTAAPLLSSCYPTAIQLLGSHITRPI
jgi:hypothetical protein